jgi:LacI family transcriptional regulator
MRSVDTTHIPQRSSLVAQTVEILSRGIRSGEWSEHLPSEREICRRLQVSRPTVRAALLTLQREGLLRTTRGQRRRVIAGPKQLARPDQPRVIGVLLSGFQETSASVQLFRELETQFHAAGFEIRVHTNLRFSGARLGERLERLVQDNPTACWLLMRSSEKVQSWFAARKLPAFVFGSRYAGVSLSSFDLDHRAICRHAAQVLLRLGHRRILLLGSASPLAGDLHSEEGFKDAFERSGHATALPSVVHHDGTVAGIRRALDAQFHLPKPPTAVVVRGSHFALTVFSHLVTSGKRVPQDVSLISNTDDKAFSHITPDIARYVVDWNVNLHRVVRAVLQLADGNPLKPSETLIFPRFHKGESLAPPNPTVAL